MTIEPPTFPDRHFLPSIPATVFVGILAFVIFGFQEPLLNSDGDLARHLRHGEYMLQQHALIRFDPFSFTRPGQPFVGFEYGSQILYTLVNRAGGLAAVTVLAGILIATTYALVARYMLRRGVEPLLAALVTGAAMISGMGHWAARPHLVTMVAVLLLLELLSPLGKRRLWAFAPLFAIWANFHGGFTYGLIVIGIFLIGAGCEAVFSRSRAAWQDVRFFGAALAISAASTLIQPRPIAVYRHILAMFGDRYIIDHTNEFLSPNFHDPGTKLFLVVMLAAVSAAIVSRRRPSFTSIGFLIAGMYFALVHQRNATLFGLTALPLLAVQLDVDWRGLGLLRRTRLAFEAASRGAATSIWVLAACALAAVLSIAHGRIGGRQLLENRFSAREFPMAAVDQARAAGLTGRIFSDFAWGGYLLYAWPEQKVFIDGNTDFYGGALMREYGVIHDNLPGWHQLVERWGFSILIVSPKAPVASEIMHDGGWRYWYCDSTAVVLVRTDAVPASSAPAVAFNRARCAPVPKALQRPQAAS